MNRLLVVAFCTCAIFVAIALTRSSITTAQDAEPDPNAPSIEPPGYATATPVPLPEDNITSIVLDGSETLGQQVPFLIDGATIQLPLYVQMAGIEMTSLCLTPIYCPQEPLLVLLATSGDQIAVGINSGAIWPNPDALVEQGDVYLSQFQFLIDTFGENKIVDTVALQAEALTWIDHNLPTSPEVPTPIAVDASQRVTGARAEQVKVYIPLVER